VTKLWYRLREISPKDIVMILYEKNMYKQNEKTLVEDVHFTSIVNALRFIGEYYPNASEDMEGLHA
jgi:hypothetical protein